MQASKDNKKWVGHAQDCLANWLLEGEYADGEDSDGEDDNEDNLPDLTVEVDDDGYPCLLTGFRSLKLKHRQKVVRSVFQKAYAVITSNSWAPVPWGEVTDNPNHYLDLECISENVIIKDPSHLQKDTITMLYSHWIDHINEEEHLKKVDDGKSSSDENGVEVETLSMADSSPKYHVARDMVAYLKSLSTVPLYQYLLAAVSSFV
ncbi:uncharacterized protein EDB91DRAFT_1243808 [Suillus paluster]|uniref:uncharacterized protein n=1 Tax=Suillus paluster TaxID=48578 RepID=UPI001B879C4E|nr:uncharacterized protein EDB91DRAFT_1243808 [Suillus paluster]KAG1751557.1 hypothetical protein EDB91DRAFT_1243808 [Suillus paluster]